MAWQVTPNAEASSFCIWHGSSSSNACNSASSKVFGLPSRGRSATSKSPSLKWRNQSLHVVSLTAASSQTFWSSQYALVTVFFEWKKKINISRKWRLFGTNSDIFTQPKVYDAKTKSPVCQNGLFTICLSLVHDVLDGSKSTSTYCWSYLLTNSGNLIAHRIHWVEGRLCWEIDIIWLKKLIFTIRIVVYWRKYFRCYVVISIYYRMEFKTLIFTFR